jgi:glycosyltransferase involved in cell wall biosynthesis
MVEVSVVVPTYNRSEHIDDMVKTIMAQTFEDLELIIVNDGSTDDTEQTLKRYEDHGRIKILHNDQNRGIAYSRNRGARESEGRYISIMDDDDRWDETKLEKQINRFRELSDEYAVVYCGGVIQKDGKIIQKFVPERRGNIYPEILSEWKLNPHSGHVIRKECFNTVGGYDDLPRGRDWDLSIRLARKYKFEYVDETLVKRLEHGENFSSNPKHVKLRGYILSKYEDEINSNPRIKRRFHGRWEEQKGYYAMLSGSYLSSVYHYSMALRYDPSIRRIVSVVAALAGPQVFTSISSLRRNVTNQQTNDIKTSQ